jgi:hypothetical protein
MDIKSSIEADIAKGDGSHPAVAAAAKGMLPSNMVRPMKRDSKTRQDDRCFMGRRYSYRYGRSTFAGAT